ncbi:MAG TPA: acyl-CoA-binding protein [Dermatophilaceae bacterium]|nr:acyl-CoA-binding protein [Dermatophilaceae bacterium]
MSASEQDFHDAAEAVKGLPTDPGNDTKLRLYALYKQSTEGDVAGKRPGFTNPVGRSKHDAWAALQGTDAGTARTEYVALVRSLTG